MLTVVTVISLLNLHCVPSIIHVLGTLKWIRFIFTVIKVNTMIKGVH